MCIIVVSDPIATLILWSSSTGTLTYNVEGIVQIARVVSTTRVQRVPINQYSPGDSILPVIQRWNALITAGNKTFGPLSDSPTTFSGIMTNLVAANAHMRIQLNTNSNVVKALRPVP